MVGDEIGLCGFVESFEFFGLAFLLEPAEFRGFLVAATDEAGFLDLQIAKWFVVGEPDAHFNHGGVVGVIGVFFGELTPAEADERHFEGGDVVETPDGVDDGLHEGRFFGTDGLIALPNA